MNTVTPISITKTEKRAVGVYHVYFMWGQWRVTYRHSTKFLGSFKSEDMAVAFAEGLGRIYEDDGFTLRPEVMAAERERQAEMRRQFDERVAKRRADRLAKNHPIFRGL